MNRRRMMMLQQGKVDLLEGYRFDNTSTAYNWSIIWLDNNTIQISHTKSSFFGANYSAKTFIGNSGSSTGLGVILRGEAMTTLEMGKTYSLTLTVKEIIQNTATVETDGVLGLGLGRYGGGLFSQTDINFSDLKAGTKIEVSRLYKDSYNHIGGAGISVSNPNLLWDIKFKVEFEEVA